MASLNMSPVATRTIARSVARRAACVPFPAPGGPRKMIRHTPEGARCSTPATNPPSLARAAEAIVVPHDQLRLDLRYRVHGHAHHDQQGGTAEIKIETQPARDPVEVVLGQEIIKPDPDDWDRIHPE